MICCIAAVLTFGLGMYLARRKSKKEKSYTPPSGMRYGTETLIPIDLDKINGAK